MTIKGDGKKHGIKSLLAGTEVTRLSADSTQNYTTSVWGFLNGDEKGAPFSLDLNQNRENTGA
jgi:hypothetical protein